MVSSAQKSWLSNARIYQVFVGRWQSASLLEHEGQVFDQLASLPFQHLKKIGINTIYLLGIFDQTGPILINIEEGIDLTNHPNRCPSPFAITNHHQTNPKLGSVTSLQSLIESLHQANFKVIVDFVPNHTGTTHPWVKEHPEYYVTDINGPVSEFSGDVFKLDYRNPSLRMEMVKIIKTIVSWGIDGVRCDMAHLVPLDFWHECITQIKDSKSGFTFIAEAYSNSVFSLDYIANLISAGFDAVYHQPLFHNFQLTYGQKQSKQNITDHVNYIQTRDDIRDHLVNYLSNHDDNFPSNKPADLIDAVAILSSLPGPMLLYNGILNYHFNRLAHHYIDVLPDNQNEVFTMPSEITSLLKTDGSASIIALDIGGSKIEAGIIDDQYQLHELFREPTVKTSFPGFIDQLVKIINKLLVISPQVKSIALAVPGIITESGEVEFSGGTLTILNHVNLKEALQKHFQLPILIENDANCFAYGEALWGAGKDHQTVVGITWGTGIGSGIIINKQMYKGAGAAGEIGHIPISTTRQSVVCGCGKSNCLESYASGSAIQNQYQELGGQIDQATVADIVKSKEVIAISIIEQAVIFMAEGITAVINMFDPDIIVIGGGLSHLQDNIFNKLKGLIANYQIKSTHRTKIVKHMLPNAALIGAAKLARDRYE